MLRFGQEYSFQTLDFSFQTLDFFGGYPVSKSNFQVELYITLPKTNSKRP